MSSRWLHLDGHLLPRTRQEPSGTTQLAADSAFTTDDQGESSRYPVARHYSLLIPRPLRSFAGGDDARRQGRLVL